VIAVGQMGQGWLRTSSFLWRHCIFLSSLECYMWHLSSSGSFHLQFEVIWKERSQLNECIMNFSPFKS